MESWILRVSDKLNMKPFGLHFGCCSFRLHLLVASGFTYFHFTLQETLSIHDSMNLQKIKFISQVKKQGIMEYSVQPSSSLLNWYNFDGVG